jgi:hypothetical protein
MDLGVEYKGGWNIIEIKLLRKNRSFEGVREEGVAQILQYRDRRDPRAPCYLVILDRRPEKPGWAERLSWEKSGIAGQGDVTVIGC